MSNIQTNFRAVDMLGTAKPVVTVVVEAPKKVAAKKVVETKVVEPVIVEEAPVEVIVEPEVITEPAAE
jgi:hypothetical protein